jgi:hypothetical protein
MSEYSFGYEDPDLSPAGSEPQPNEGPKWFREYMGKVSKQLDEIKAENASLKAEKQRDAVAESLKAKGYAPQAAGLYAGKPEGLDDWLTANAGALAKLPVAGGEESAGEELATPAGVPQSIVTPESQAELARMQAMGTSGVAAPQGSDKELAARIDAMDEPQFDEFMRSQNNRFF